mmetsp:Transcript_19085/g.61481  ORF Transcript_19085/g.61481 Transcript_19085/m.61481 type:complete len:124 (+) Transcript_19085:32-403(+)
MWSLLASPSLVVHPVSPHALPAQPPAHVVRTPLQQPELPSSLVAGLFGLGEPKPDGKNVFKGTADDLQLDSLLSSVPADMGGKQGLKKDQEGVARLKERQEAEAKAAEAKAAALIAIEAAKGS